MFTEQRRALGLNMTPMRETELMEAATARLGELTGLGVTLQPTPKGLGPQVDGQIRITHGHDHWTYLVACRAQVDRVAMLHQVHQQLKELPGEGLLLAPYLGPELARVCQEIGLPFLDAAGNAFLKQKGLYVLRVGQKVDKTHFQTAKPMRAFDRSGLRIVFALLVEPALLQATYRDIAKAAGVALGTVGWVLTDLREHGFLVEDHQGKRRWLDRQRVLQAWVTNFPLRLRERLHVRRYVAKEAGWWKAAKPEDFNGYWGGEVAAAKLMDELIPKTVTLYLPETHNAFLAKHRLRADPQGPIEVLETFWDLPQDPNAPAGIAPPLLVFADLQGIGDPRTLEQARMIHGRYLA